MANLTRSGYLASATAIVWTSGQALDSLTDNEYTDLSDEVDNSSGGAGNPGYMFADVEVSLASATWDGADAGIEVYLIPTVDGTNYPNWTGNSTTETAHNNAYFVGFLPIADTNSAYAWRGVLRDVELPNGKYKWAFRNRGNVTLAGSGNSASWRPHSVAA